MKLLLSFCLVFLLISPHNLAQQKSQDDYSKLRSLSIEDLMDIQISTASKYVEKVGEVPASSVIVMRDDIEKYGYTTIEEVLQNVPGLYGIFDYAEGGLNFGVRGYWSFLANDDVIILINNVPQTKNIHTNHPLAQIPVPVEAIDRIEIVRGPMSVIYGSGAFFGAINIITNETETDYTTHISAGIASGNTKRFFIGLRDNRSELKYSVNASLYSTDGINHPYSKMMSNPEALLDYGMPIDYSSEDKLERHNKFFNISVSYGDFSADANIIDALEEIVFTMPSSGEGATSEYYDYNFSLGYKKTVSEKLELNGRVTFFKDRMWENYFFFTDDFFGIQQLESKAFEITADAYYKATDNLNITSGVYHKEITEVYNMYHLPSFGADFFKNNKIALTDDAPIATSAIYIQADLRLTEKLLLVGGLRLEQSPAYEIAGKFNQVTDTYFNGNIKIDKDDIEFIPRLAAIYSFNNDNILKLLYGRATNRPSFFQNYLLIRQTYQKYLDPESIETVELNYTSSFAKGHLLNISLFHNVLDNLISRTILYDDTGNYADSYFSNAGKLVTNGIELSLSIQASDNLFVELSGTYQDTEDKKTSNKNIEVAYSPKFLGYIKSKYQVNPDFFISLTGFYVDEMESAWDESPVDPNSEYVPIGRIGKKSQSYFSVSMNARYENIVKSGLYLQLGINNLLDTDIWYPVTTNNPWLDKGTLDFGRKINFSVGYKF